MKLNVVMVGIGNWHEYTLPAVLSIQRHEPEARIILVNLGEEQYPEIRGVTMVRRKRKACYAHAINIGIEKSRADWYFITNNDVLCTGSFFVPTMNPQTIYAMKKHTVNHNQWFDNCFVFISHETYKRVGRFDKKFKIAAFEDADYSFRAENAGIGIAIKPMPFYHFEGTTRTVMHGFDNVRDANYEYLKQKYPERKL